MFVSWIHSRHSFLEFKAFSPPLRAAARSTSSTLLHHSQIAGSWRRKPVSCREAEGVVTELWSPRIATTNWLCSSVTTADTAFSLRGLEAGLWAFRLPMFTTCDDMLFLNPFPLFLFWIPSMFQEFIPAIPFCFEASNHSNPYQKLEAPESDSTLHQLCIMVASCPSLCCSYRKKPVSCREAKGLVTELCSPRFVTSNTVIVSKIWITGHWWCSQLWHVTAANQWTVVEIELLATVCWKWGFQPFSCRCSLNVMHCRKEICSTCLSKESIPAIPFRISKHPLPTRSLRLLRAGARSISSALCLHHAHPFVAAEEKKQSQAEKQRFWSPSCCLQDLLRAVQWLIVSKIWIAGYWLCSQSWHVTAANQKTVVEIEFLARVGWKWGRRPFSCPSWQIYLNGEKRYVRHVCLRNPCFLWNHVKSKPPLPTRSLRSLRAAVCSNSFALCLYHAHPFVVAAEKRPVSCREAKGLVTELWSPRIVAIYWLLLYDCCKESF